jgi:transcriptional regulator with XRE-family HTH domain
MRREPTGVATDDQVARPTGLGALLRRTREAQRVTLAQVAETAGLTKGFLSKVERDVATPSVASLLRLCEALGTSIGELFEGGPTRALVRAGAYPGIRFGGVAMEESLLTPPRERRLQVIHSVIHPGGGSGEESYAIPADVEFVLVLDGALRLTVGEDVHLLATGDALTFSPRTRHAFVNPSPDRDAVVVWVLSPALPGPVDDAAGRR